MRKGETMERKRLEEDGVEFENPDHWETWETKIYIIRDHRSQGTNNTYLTIPIDIIRHLNLVHKQKVKVAIKRIP